METTFSDLRRGEKAFLTVERGQIRLGVRDSTDRIQEHVDLDGVVSIRTILDETEVAICWNSGAEPAFRKVELRTLIERDEFVARLERELVMRRRGASQDPRGAGASSRSGYTPHPSVTRMAKPRP